MHLKELKQVKEKLIIIEKKTVGAHVSNRDAQYITRAFQGMEN